MKMEFLLAILPILPGYRVKLNSTGKIVESSDVLFSDSTIMHREFSHFHRRESMLNSALFFEPDLRPLAMADPPPGSTVEICNGRITWLSRFCDGYVGYTVVLGVALLFLEL